MQRVRDGYSVLSTKLGRVSAFGFPLLAIMGSGHTVQLLGLRIMPCRLKADMCLGKCAVSLVSANIPVA